MTTINHPGPAGTNVCAGTQGCRWFGKETPSGACPPCISAAQISLWDLLMIARVPGSSPTRALFVSSPGFVIQVGPSGEVGRAQCAHGGADPGTMCSADWSQPGPQVTLLFSKNPEKNTCTPLQSHTHLPRYSHDFSNVPIGRDPCQKAPIQLRLPRYRQTELWACRSQGR